MILHANNLYQIEEKWQQMIKNAMKEDFSWDKSVEKYTELYEDLTGRSDC
jgi:glycogen synthase